MDRRYTLDELANKTIIDLYNKAVSSADDKQVNIWSTIHGKPETYYNQIHLESIIDIITQHGWAKNTKGEFFIITSKGIELVNKYPTKPFSDWRANRELDHLSLKSSKSIRSAILWFISIIVSAIVTYFFTA